MRSETKEAMADSHTFCENGIAALQTLLATEAPVFDAMTDAEMETMAMNKTRCTQMIAEMLTLCSRTGGTPQPDD